MGHGIPPERFNGTSNLLTAAALSAIIFDDDSRAGESGSDEIRLGPYIHK